MITLTVTGRGLSMNHKHQPDRQESLKRLREEFGVALQARLDILETVWGRLRQGTWEHKEVEVFHRELHTVTGSAGTFGFTEVSVRARQTLTQLRTIMTRAEAPTSEEVEVITASMDEIRRLLPPRRSPGS